MVRHLIHYTSPVSTRRNTRERPMRKLTVFMAAAALALSFATVAKAAEEIRLGVLEPMSGKAAKSGQETVEGIKLAVDIINGKYDIDLPFARTEGLPGKGGAKIKLLLEDHGGRPERGRAIAERLITQEKVHILQGAFFSSVAAPSSQVAEKYGVPYVTGESESPALTERGLKVFFSVTPTAKDIARDFFSFLKEVSEAKGVPLRHVAVIHVNDVWGTSLYKAASQIYKDYGFEEISTISYSPDVADLKSEVLQLKRIQPDVLLQASFDPDAILSVRNYKALRFSPTAVLAMGASFQSPNFIKALGANADYNFSHTKFHTSLIKTRKGAGKVAELFKQRTAKDLWGTPARAFTGTMVIADALNRAKSLKHEDIIQALRETNVPGADTIMPYKGVKFNEKGQNVLATGLITQIHGGKHYPVWPDDVAVRKAVFPMPKWEDR